MVRFHATIILIYINCSQRYRGSISGTVFHKRPRLVLETKLPPLQWVPLLFSHGWSGRSVTSITPLHLSAKWDKCSYVPTLAYVLMLYTEKTLPVFPYYRASKWPLSNGFPTRIMRYILLSAKTHSTGPDHLFSRPHTSVYVLFKKIYYVCKGTNFIFSLFLGEYTITAPGV